MPVERGRKLGPYEILELLGKGGMGEVYRARDAKLARDVAIKVLPAEFSRQRERLERFEREARLLAQLNHTNIATLYGFEESDGEQFLVMELVEGETLAERIARGPIPFDEVLPLFIQIAEGVEAAHEKGIIHRDLKPPNIKITPDGKVKILDFGLAKAFAPDKDVSVEASQSPTLTKGTALGAILGTASYMSPEQARGKLVDRRTDVWAFGCCLFEACTGKLAFSGETVPDTIAGVLDREPPWANLGEVSSGISRLLRKCLTKDRHHRLQSIGDARVELELAPSEPVVLQAPSSSTSRAKMRLAVVGAFLLGLVVAAVISGLRSESSELRVERFVLPLPEGEELYTARDFSAGGSVAISPNGRHIAFVTEGKDSRRLYLRTLDQTDNEFIEGSEGAKTPFFSPDSQWLGFQTGGSLKKVSVAGLAPVTIGENPDPRGATWSVDGTIVTTSGPARGLILFSADGGEPRQLTTPDRSQMEKTHRFPHALPDGDTVLFTLGRGDNDLYDDASIAAASMDSGEYSTLLEGGSYPRYSPTGHLVYARAGALLAVGFDAVKLEVTGAPVMVVDGVSGLPMWGTAAFDLSSEGSLVYAPGGAMREHRRIVWVDRRGEATPLIEETRPFQGSRFRLSPDQTKLGVTLQGANNSVWVYDLRRGVSTRMTFAYDNFFEAWTPDAERITYSSDREGLLFWQRVEGGGPEDKLTEGQGAEWAPDGQTLIFRRNRDVWTMPMTGQREASPFVQSPANETDLALSPDGRWLAYRSDESGKNEIYVQPFPEVGVRQQVSDGGSMPRWNPDGSELFYRSGSRMMAVDVELADDIVLGKPHVLFDRPNTDSGFDVALDGKRFLMMDIVEAEKAPTELILVQNWSEELKRLVPVN